MWRGPGRWCTGSVNEIQAQENGARPRPAPAGPVPAAAEPGAPSRGAAAPGAPLTGRLPAAVWLIAGLFTAVELALSDRYGFQQDELYFLVAGHHLAFGYVDQPPLAVLLTRTTDLFGVNPTAIRILPAFAGGAVVLIAARLAALFGGGRGGRVIAALGTATAAVLLGAVHIGNTTPYDLLAWALVLLCVTTALLRDRPRWWLGAGAAAGIGLQNEYLVTTLIGALVLGLLATSAHRRVLATPWPWLGGLLALAIWAPNLVWQFAHGWPQLTMASALHQQNTSAADYILGLPGQLQYVGILGVPLVIAGFVRLYRSRDLRFLAVAATLVVLYVLIWVPGKVYYADGMLPVVLAAGSVSAEGWLARGRRPRLRRGLIAAGVALGIVFIVPSTLPVLPVAALHQVPPENSLNDGVGWPQLAALVTAQDRALTRAGQAPVSVYTGAYAEAGALDRYGAGQLPPVLSAHNSFWTWGPGDATDGTVLVVDALDQLRPYFASCRQLTVFNPPDQVQNDWNDLTIGVCTGPTASWSKLWPRLKHYD
jgi:4-amino-4-deoxy-L-arabinose transferase-like glycosyltransferase